VRSHAALDLVAQEACIEFFLHDGNIDCRKLFQGLSAADLLHELIGAHNRRHLVERLIKAA